MPVVRVNDLNIAYETLGPEEAPPVLMIMGFNMTLSAWPEPFLQHFLDAGLRLILMDNRDAGLSDRVDAMAPGFSAVIGTRLFGGHPRVPYTLEDMASDGLGLLDALSIQTAHVVGISMGGMIAQCMALAAPSRHRSLGLLMTHGGALRFCLPSPRLLPLAMRQPEPNPEAMLAYALEFWHAVAGPQYPPDNAKIRESLARSWRRAPRMNGRERQAAAIAAAPDRTPRLRGLDVPTVIIHGDADPLVSVGGGRQLARVIPGARYEEIPGLGHHLPEALHARISSQLIHTIRQSDECAA